MANGHSYILVGTCATTKYAIAKSYKNTDAKSKRKSTMGKVVPGFIRTKIKENLLRLR